MAEEGQDPFLASLSDDGRYRLLVEAVTDYAIYMLDRNGIVASWNAGAARFKGYTPTEIIGQHFSRFYTQEDRDIGSRPVPLRLPRAKAGSRMKAGAFARTGSCSGPVSLSIPSETKTVHLLASRRSHAT